MLNVISDKTKENRQLKDELHKMVDVIAAKKNALTKVGCLVALFIFGHLSNHPYYINNLRFVGLCGLNSLLEKFRENLHQRE